MSTSRDDLPGLPLLGRNSDVGSVRGEDVGPHRGVVVVAAGLRVVDLRGRELVLGQFWELGYIELNRVGIFFEFELLGKF